MGYYLNRVSYFLLLLIPPLLISGPFLPDLTITYCCIYFLFLVSFRELLLKFLIKYKIFKFYLIFILIITTSSLFSDYILVSLKSSLLHIRFIIFCLIYYYLINYIKNFIKFQQIILLLTLVFLNFDSLYQLITGFNIIGLKIQEAFIPRPTSFFGKDLKLGNFLFIFNLLSLVIAVYTNKFLKITLFVNLFSWFMIFFSGERTSLILYSLSIFIILIIFCLDKKFLKENKYKISIVFLIIFVFVANNGFSKKMYVSKMIINPLKELSIIGDTEFMPAHINHFKASIYIFKENLIIGSGPNTFSKECKKFEKEKKVKACTTHSHNFYLQLLAETGILGFLFGISFYLYLFINFLKTLKFKLNSDQCNLTNSFLIINILLLMVFFPFRPTGDLFNNWMNIINLFPVGIYIYLQEKIRKLKIN